MRRQVCVTSTRRVADSTSMRPAEISDAIALSSSFVSTRNQARASASDTGSAAGGAIISQFGGDEDYAGQATLDLNVTFLNAATADVVAEGRVLRHSRALAFTQVDVRMEDGTHVATGRATFSIIRKRS